jgi:hypothetical protein
LTSQVIGLIEIDAPAWDEAVWEDLSAVEDMTFPRRPSGTGIGHRRLSAIETCSSDSLEVDQGRLLQDLQVELDLLLRRIRAK